MKLQTDFLPSIAATTSSTLPSDMGAISSIACGRAAYRNCRPERHVSILDVASAPIWLVSLIKVSRVTGIEPSAEMRRLAAKNIPANLVSDGSVLQLPASASSIDFVYAIEVFRYLNARDNAQGHREIVRVLKPGGTYFGTYVNKWALDGFRQLSQFRKLKERLTGAPRRYHVEFETPSSLCDKLMAAGFSRVTAHGAMFAPLRVLHKASPRLGAAVSRLTMPHETWLSDYGPFRSFAGHLIIVARR